MATNADAYELVPNPDDFVSDEADDLVIALMIRDRRERAQHHERKGIMPTRKWMANVVTAAAALGTMWASTGGWEQEETIALIGLVSAALISYLVPNDPANPAS